jgi:hypothetical protein
MKYSKLTIAAFSFAVGLMVKDLGGLIWDKFYFQREAQKLEAYGDQLNDWHEITEGSAERLGIMAPCLVKDTFTIADGREVPCKAFTDRIKSGAITYQ